MSEGLDFSDIERAIATWLSRATGLPAEDTTTGGVARVVPVNAQVPQPPMPYVTFKVPVPRRVGGQDEVLDLYDPRMPAGQEIIQTVRGQREFVVTIQAFTQAASGGKDFEGNRTARDYLSRVQTFLALPSITALLETAGLAFIDIVGAADFSARLGPAGQGRATLDVLFRCVDTVSERTGYIATATPTGTLS